MSVPSSEPLASSTPSVELLDSAWSALGDLERQLADAVDPVVREAAELVLHQSLPATGSVAADSHEVWRRQPAVARFVEQFVIDVSGITDEMTSALSATMRPDQLYAFVCWLQSAEALRRASLVLQHHPRGVFR